MNDYLKQILTLYKDKKIEKATAFALIEEYQKIHDTSKQQTSTKIAVIGYSCRMPMAENKDLFWERLRNGVNCVQPFPENRRKDIESLADAIPKNKFKEGKKYWDAGFLDNIDLFDNEFFRILPAEATIMDPQQRLFLELAHEAFEDAGYNKKRLKGSNTGVFLGDVINEYRKIVPHVTASAVVGNISPFITSRVSYFYDLHGPTLNISTTCSTSLVAIHAACQAILSGECEMALTGAINLRLFPFELKDDPIDALGITSEDGICRAFDNKANGIVRGEGGGAIVLKSYGKALEDKDHIYAVILGSSVNNDGRSSSVGAPNPSAQQQLLKETWKKCGINPRTIDYFEAHGTGTKIGDPIEIQAITKAMREYTEEKQFCGLGSVKTNLGHLTGGASGLAGLIKVLLSLKHKEIPPTLHFEEPNDLIDFPSTPIYITDKLKSWEQSNHPRRAAVSAFGFNGTNCHLIVDEYEQTSAPQDQGEFLWTYSHQTLEGLKSTLTKHLSFYKRQKTELTAGNIAYTLSVGRDHYTYRTTILCSSLDHGIKSIEQLLNQDSLIGVHNHENIVDPRLIKTAQEYMSAKEINWDDFYTQSSFRRTPLPSYCYNKKRFWVESASYQDDDKEFLMPSSTLESTVIHLDPESELKSVFQRIMGLSTIQDTDNFFELGGDSLLGIQLINEIHRQFNKKITFQDLFDKPRICDLLPLLTERKEQTYSGIQTLNKSGLSALSYGQRRLWILHQMQDNPIAYNMYECYQFDGDLKLNNFKDSLNKLIVRHPSLRTVIINSNGQPMQQVLDQKEFALTVVENGNDELIEEFKKIPFDLENGPLIKALLIKQSDNSHLFFIVMHHIISDGTSLKVLFDDLLRSYQGVDLPKLHVNYVDYSQWQQSDQQEQRMTAMKNFWLSKLQSETLPVCEIMGDRSRPAVFNFEGARKLFKIPQEMHKQMQALAAEKHATLFMTLLASVYTLIYRYTGQKDIIVGSPVSGRSHYDLRSIVGFFVNTLTLRTQIDPEQNFKELLSKTRNDVLESLEHQDYPFDRLVDQLNLSRDTSRSPLFNINVALQNFELDAESKEALKDLKVSRYDLPHHSCKWDLEFEFIKRDGDALECYVEYYKGVYSDDFIEVLFSTYLQILSEVTQNPDLPIETIKLSPASFQLTDESIPILIDDHATLHQAFERQVSNNPDHPAVNLTSYHELNKRANQLASFLKNSKGCVPEELIGIYMNNSVEAVVSILAVLKSGCAYVPMDVKAPLERIKTIINQGNIRTVLSKKKYLHALNKLQWESNVFSSYICLDSACIQEEVEETSAGLMDEDLWNQVASESGDDITSSGWVSSETGLPFSRLEMDEYQQNVLDKILPHLSKQSHVLEVGCGSGLTLFSIAKHVKEYIGTDLSKAIVLKNQAKATKDHVTNVKFYNLPAHQMDCVEAKNLDCIIFNSVIHCFPGVNYFKDVLKKVIEKANDQAVIFLGDLMDQSLKITLENWMAHCKTQNKDKGFRTKTDWSNELFISRQFLEDLQADIPEIVAVQCSLKNHTVENELTRFRYDAILTINKKCMVNKPESFKHKHQHDLSNLEREPTQNLNQPVLSNALAYVLFTSGSTGVPKGVMVEHRTVLNYIEWCTKNYFKDTQQLPSTHLYSPLTFDLTVTSIFCPLLAGSSLHTHCGEFDAVLQDIIHSNEGNILKLTPTHLNMILEMGQPIKNIHKFILGGEALYSAKVHQFSEMYDRPIQVYNEYGPTEATVGCIVYEWNQKSSDDPTQLPIGTPISNATIHILDEHLQPVPVGGTGEIYIGGKCLARGYLNNTDLTAEKFLKDPFIPGERMYRTGDLGRLLPSGQLEYIGRNDRQVKIRGFRIELNEIEGCLLKHPLIKEAAIIVRDEPGRGNVLCGYFTSGQSISITELRDWLSQSLPEYMIPTYITPVAEMPHNTNGKIDYLKLPNPMQETNRSITAGRNPPEKALIKIWGNVLGFEEELLSVFDDFFEVGGDSIIAMRILPKAKEQGILLSIKDIFQYRTIASICSHAEIGAVLEIDQKEITGTCDITPVQRWFFDQNQPHPEYFNMAYMFHIPLNTNIELLEEAIIKSFEKHDALRSTFEMIDGSWKQIIHPVNSIAFTLKEISEANQEIINTATAELQSSFDLKGGPLFGAIVFDKGQEGKRLFIAMHHLIIDGVSWRYLVEDIESIYKNKESKLPQKTHSFINYSQVLKSYSEAELKIDYWLNIPSNEYLAFNDQDSVTQHAENSLHFDKEFTRELLKINVNDSLLTAIFVSLADKLKVDKLLFNHEGHGRDNLKDLDIMRTMGWMTTIYPVALTKKNTMKETLMDIHDTLQRVSQFDQHYGIAKYTQNDSRLKELNPQLLFNYFGRVGADLMHQQNLLSNCSETFAPLSHAKNRVPHLLEVNAIIMEDKLQLSIVHDIHTFDHDFIDQWKSDITEALTQIIGAHHDTIHKK
jgi:amino acid adenylation domain-containing protein/non-ribosomal peptide synthase protein (TIGR01720 family)